MIRKSLLTSLFLLLTVLTTSAQNHIRGSIKPFDGYSYALLYRMDGLEQNFVGNTSLINGAFDFEATKQGMYRVVFDLQKGVYIDVFYTGSDVSFTLDPSNPSFTVKFDNSEDNSIYYTYKLQSAMAQNQLDQTQVAYLKEPSAVLKEQYLKENKELKKIQQAALNKAKGKYIAPIIEANLRDNPDEPVDSPIAYLDFVRDHYFDHLDFNNKTVLSTDYLYTKISDFIFYLNYSQDLSVQSQLYKQAIDICMSKITSETFRATTLELILSQFESQENTEMTDWVIETYYLRLPYEFQDQEFIADLKASMATAIGAIAPDFTWEDGRFSEVYANGPTILVFWSSSCGHCLAEIPELYRDLQEDNRFQVIAVGLEEEDVEWKRLTAKMPDWIHVLGLKKWENPIARSYNIIGTPTYFIVNPNGQIAAKPGDLTELLELINN